MTEATPPWIVEARKHIGLTEYAGRKHNPQVLRWWKAIHAPFTDDETPWCAGFVGGVLEQTGYRSTRSAMARSYQTWKHGEKLDRAIYGAVVVFWRGNPKGPSGHVGFVVGEDRQGRLLVLGGNQGNKVSVAPFDKSRVVGYYWPKGAPKNNIPLPLIAHKGPSSTNEA